MQTVLSSVVSDFLPAFITDDFKVCTRRDLQYTIFVSSHNHSSYSVVCSESAVSAFARSDRVGCLQVPPLLISVLVVTCASLACCCAGMRTKDFTQATMLLRD